jgi:hypothetical protein
MEKETRICQNCKQNFVIEPEDFDFYKKIDVPPPTWCPECRLIRRFSWRNERSFYKRKCGLTGEDMISVFSPEKPYKAYSSKAWWSDGWDPMTYGVDYDPKTPFFLQLDALMKKTPLLGLYTHAASLKNSEYVNMALGLKDCYMVTNADYDENCVYGSYVAHCKDCVDGLMTALCEHCYELVSCMKCYNTTHSFNCNYCVDVNFSRNCVGCQNCFGCVNLHNKQYYVWNEACSKEKYQDLMKELMPMTRGSIAEYLHKAQEQWRSYPMKYMRERQNSNVTGDYVFNSKNSKECYVVAEVENCKFCALVTSGEGSLKDSYDCTHFVSQSELCYESIQSGHQSSGVRFTLFGVMGCHNVDYGVFLANCSDCLGCVSLRDKKYCILNKQYSEEEYDRLRSEIIKDMEKNPYKDDCGIEYRYGEFFPPALSPFGYNETSAGEFFPISKEEAKKSGYRWYERTENVYKPTIKGSELPEKISEVTDNITKEVVACEKTGKAYRIVPSELDFLRRMKLPIPSVHPDVRHQERIVIRNPFRLWRRKCQCVGKASKNGAYKNAAAHRHGDGHCPNEFETSYAPDRPEIVYCESCYNSEVV